MTDGHMPLVAQFLADSEGILDETIAVAEKHSAFLTETDVQCEEDSLPPRAESAPPLGAAPSRSASSLRSAAFPPLTVSVSSRTGCPLPLPVPFGTHGLRFPSGGDAPAPEKDACAPPQVFSAQLVPPQPPRLKRMRRRLLTETGRPGRSSSVPTLPRLVEKSASSAMLPSCHKAEKAIDTAAILTELRSTAPRAKGHGHGKGKAEQSAELRSIVRRHVEAAARELRAEYCRVQAAREDAERALLQAQSHEVAAVGVVC